MRGLCLINSLPVRSDDLDFFAADARELYRHAKESILLRHQIVNSGLSVLLTDCVAVSILLLRKLALAFRALSQYGRVYQLQLTPRVFLKGNVATELSLAWRRYFERQQQTQARLREEEKLRALRTG